MCLVLATWPIDPGVGFLVPAGMALIFGGVALALSIRVACRGSTAKAAACLLGTGGVLAQTGLAAIDPSTLAGFLVGTVGASTCFAVGVGELQGRTSDGVAQAVAVIALLWIGGTIPVVGSVVGQPWPFVTGAILSLSILAAFTLPQLDRADTSDNFSRSWIFLAVAFGAPSAVGLGFGTEILFVAYLVAFGTVVICWSLLRQAYSGR